MFQLGIIAHKTVTNPSAGFDNQTRYPNKRVNESLEFHTHYLQTNRAIGQQHAIPGFQIPGQGGNYHVGPIGIQSVGGRLNGSDAVLQLLNVIFVIGAPAENSIKAGKDFFVSLVI